MALTGCEKTISAQEKFDGPGVSDNRNTFPQDAQKAVQQGRSE
jgi:hypothetical protein